MKDRAPAFRAGPRLSSDWYELDLPGFFDRRYLFDIDIKVDYATGDTHSRRRWLLGSRSAQSSRLHQPGKDLGGSSY